MKDFVLKLRLGFIFFFNPIFVSNGQRNCVGRTTATSSVLVTSGAALCTLGTRGACPCRSRNMTFVFVVEAACIIFLVLFFLFFYNTRSHTAQSVYMRVLCVCIRWFVRFRYVVIYEVGEKRGAGG